MISFHLLLILALFSSFGSAALDHADILKCVQALDMGKLEWLLTEGVNPDYFDKQGDRWTPLIYAVAKGSSDFTDRLLRAGANPNQSERDGWTPLHFAAAYGHMSVGRQLLEAGASTKLKTKKDATPLDLAKEYEKYEMMEILEAAQNSGRDSDKVAAEYRINIERQFEGISMTSENSALLFGMASNGPNHELHALLAKDDINVNAKSAGDGRTALHRAAHSGDVERLTMLLEKGAYINEVDSQSWSALMFAASTSNYQNVQYLLVMGADPFVRNIHGISSYVLAAENGHPEVSWWFYKLYVLNVLIIILFDAGVSIDNYCRVGTGIA